MKKLGEMLKSEREKRKLSIHEIGIYLKINPKVLQAIEDGDASKLPAKTFLRGFVRSYAQYLRMDVKAMLNLFQEEMGTTHPEDVIQPTNTKIEEPAEPGATPAPVRVASSPKPRERTPVFKEPQLDSLLSNRTLGLVVGILLILMIVIVSKIIDKYQKERVVETIEATPIEATPVVEATGATGSTADATGATAPTGTLIYTAELPPGMKPTEPAEPPKPAETAKPVAPPVATTPPPKPVEPPKPVAAKPPEPVKPPEPPKPAADATKPADQAAAAPAKPAEAAKKPTEVIVEALGNVSVTYDLGDGNKKTVELTADQFHIFKSKTLINLEVSDAGAVNVFVNGKDRGIPGQAGKSTKLSYP